MRILVGAVVSLPPYSPGMAWNWMQFATGLRDLGHEVYYVEEVDRAWCVDTDGNQTDFEHSINRQLFSRTMKRFGLMDTACQIVRQKETTQGLSPAAMLSVSRDADLLINMSGHITSDFVFENVERRVYVDQDPVYTQLWYAEYGADLNLGKHNIFFSVGLNIGTARTSIPDCGVEWHHILPPVMLEHWPNQFDASCRCFTTITSWGTYNDLEFRGEWYRNKAHEFEHFATLPQQAHQDFELVVKNPREDDEILKRLRTSGWNIREGCALSSLEAYQAYIAQSRAEIGIAKNAYVKGCSGWFSDRSAHYLAAGKPVLAQSTGFEHALPTGQGIITFSNMEEAVAGVESINRDYASHCRASREFAAEYLDHRKVLSRMLETCMASPRSR